MISAEQLYADFHPKVSAYVRGKIANPHDAEDLTSTIFLKIVRKLDSFDPTRASLSTWIYTITRNTVTDHFRARHSTVAFADYMSLEEAAPVITNESLDLLAEALLALKETERDLIILHYYQGHSLKDAAELIGMSYSNAKVVHKKSLNSLRSYYTAG